MPLYDKPRIADASIKQLVGPFFLVDIVTRDVKTVYGDNVAVDLYVAAVEDRRFTEDIRNRDSVLIFSGFSAGLVRQAGQASPRDFPTWAKIESVQLPGNRSTTELVPVDNPPEFGRLPLGTLDGLLGGDAQDDDIPF